ncbi:MAG: hypothetical protein ACYTGZ_14285 [Planctomycetota bacterium]
MIRATLIVGLLAAVAAAGPTRTLTFKDGKKKTVVLESCDDEGLDYSQAGKKTRVAWSDLKPESAFDARKELTPYDDAAKRMVLADFARKLKLFPEAMEQYEIALALGAMDEATYEKKAKQVETEEIAHLTAVIDTLLKSKAEPTTCLSAIKRLKSRYPDHEKNDQYAPHIKALVEILANRKETEQNAEVQAKDSKELAALRKKIEKLQGQLVKALRKAVKMREESKKPIERRSISGVKKALLEPRGAERYYKQVRKLLREMVRTDPRFRIIDKKEIQKGDDSTATQLVECYLPVARMMMRERNYRGALKMVQKILFYDPIHEEALDMAREIRKKRITFKASDITGIRGPIVTGPGG